MRCKPPSGGHVAGRNMLLAEEEYAELSVKTGQGRGVSASAPKSLPYRQNSFDIIDLRGCLDVPSAGVVITRRAAD